MPPSPSADIAAEPTVVSMPNISSRLSMLRIIAESLTDTICLKSKESNIPRMSARVPLSPSDRVSV